MNPVLIIDDDQRNTYALSAVLKAKGCKTLIVNNMVEAFSLLQEEAWHYSFRYDDAGYGWI